MNKTTVIHHHADFDGIFCREIARKFLPEATLIGWDYGEPTPAKADIDGTEQLYMLDISVPDLMDHPRLIWIDHHKSAIEKCPETIPGYRIDGVAACRLAWQWFSAPNRLLQADLFLPSKEMFLQREVNEPLAVRLAGEYDIWDKRDPRAEIFQYGLRSRELTPEDWKWLLSPNEKPSVSEIEAMMDAGHAKDLLEPDGTAIPAIVHQLLDAGSLLQAYQQRNDAGMMHRSFVIEFEGLKFLALTTARCNSLTFASKDVPETGHDALMGFYHNGKAWTISLYHAKHRTDLDLSAIAVKYGGGGHRGACGFQAAKLPFL